MGIIRELIGHNSYSIMDRRAIVGNSLGLPEHWDGDATFVADTDASNPTKWVAGTLTCTYLKAHIMPDSEGLLYEYLKNGKLKYITIYGNHKTDIKQDIIIDKDGCPEYDNLI